MAAPNYQFEKRKRDLQKQAKKKEKAQKKLENAGKPSEPAIIEPVPLIEPEEKAE